MLQRTVIEGESSNRLDLIKVSVECRTVVSLKCVQAGSTDDHLINIRYYTLHSTSTLHSAFYRV